MGSGASGVVDGCVRDESNELVVELSGKSVALSVDK